MSQAAETLRSSPRLYRDFFTFIVVFRLLHTFNIVCAFVLTFPSKDGDLCVKRVVKLMFMDKLSVCVVINDYNSVDVFQLPT